MTLKERLAKVEAEQKIAAKLATGKFKDTGIKYTPESATADHSNCELRQTANCTGKRQITWN